MTCTYVRRFDALLNALPPAEAAALNDIVNQKSTGNTAADFANLNAAIGPAVGVPVPGVSAATNDRKLLAKSLVSF